MTGRRTALIIGLIACAASLAEPAAARQFFDEENAIANESSQTGGYEVSFALDELVREQVQPIMDAMPTIPRGADIVVETGQAPGTRAFHIERFSYDPASGRFTGIAISEAGNFQVRGRATINVPAMIPSRRIDAGEIVSLSDLVEVSVPLSSINQHTLISADDVVGKEARRAIVADRPIPAQSVMEPLSVKRGASVLISLSEGGLDLSSPGRSLQDGSVGEIVRVMNTHSSNVVHAVVVGEGLVRAVTASSNR